MRIYGVALSVRGSVLLLLLGLSLLAQDAVDHSLPADATNLIVNTRTQAAIQTAINSAQDASRVIYIPAGTYEITSTLGGYNGYYRFMTLWGAGPGKTVLKLKDNCAGFTDSLNPKPVLELYYSNNATHGCYFRNLTVNTGSGNHGAIGIEHNSHNGGIIDNVEITSGDGSGVTGLSMMKTPGPSLVSNLTVRGFKYGIRSGTGMYAMTLTDITLENQRSNALYNIGVPLSIMNLTCRNAGTAVRNGGAAMAIVNGSFTRTGSGTFADAAVISVTPLHVRNLTATGYAKSIQDFGATVTAPTVAEYTSSGLMTAPNTAQHSLGLPIKDPPRIPWDANLANWANVRSFASPQAALNSGKPVVYFPNFARDQTYIGNITIPATVKRLVGLMTNLSGTITVDSQDSTAAVVIDQLGGFTLNHTGKCPVYLKGSYANITTKPGAGDLFIDDYCCSKITVNGSNVQIRQCNIEVAQSPMLLNNGGRLAILGYKTEMPYTVLQNTNHAATEILGGFIYPTEAVPAGVPMHVNDNSSLFLFHNLLGEYPVFVRETQSGVTIDTAKPLITCMYASNTGGMGAVADRLPPSGAVPADWRFGLTTRLTSAGLSVAVNSREAGSYRVIVAGTDGRVVFAASGTGAGEIFVPTARLGAGRAVLVTVSRGGAVASRLVVNPH